MTQSQTLKSILKDHGITPTAQRMLIAQHLFAKPQHITADELYQQLSNSVQSISKATVYNSLGLFIKKV